LLGRSQTNVQKIATQSKKVLGVLQEGCCCVPQQSQHQDVPTIFGKARGYMLCYHHQALESEDGGREEVKSFE
jgi:hypothetical protein